MSEKDRRRDIIVDSFDTVWCYLNELKYSGGGKPEIGIALEHIYTIAHQSWRNECDARDARETLRDRFAMAFIAGGASSPEEAYAAADRMLEHREIRCSHTYANGPQCSRRSGHEGQHLYRCASPKCPGYPYPASKLAHPCKETDNA